MIVIHAYIKCFFVLDLRFYVIYNFGSFSIEIYYKSKVSMITLTNHFTLKSDFIDNTQMTQMSKSSYSNMQTFFYQNAIAIVNAQCIF